MEHGISDDILQLEGFREIGRLSHRIRLSVWWHAEAKLQVIQMPLGSKTLLKGHKSYYMKTITEEGETYARDIGQLQDYLESHFPEIHLSFSLFRDVSRTVATQHLRRKTKAEAPTIDIPTTEDLARLQRELERSRGNLESMKAFAGLDSGRSSLLSSYTNRQIADGKRSVKKLKEDCRKQSERLKQFKHLQREYERKGSAASFSFSISSNLQLVTTPEELRDALQSIVKELADLHRYQVTQKLSGGRLNIHVEEAQEPVLVWLEEWMGGALSPRQLDRLEPDFAVLREAANDRRMVAPSQDIRLNGHVKEDRKLLGARVVSTLVRRLDRADRPRLTDEEIPESALPLRLGRWMTDERVSRDDFILPLVGANNIYVSGTTGSGKSFTGRVIIEEAARYKGLNVLVLDPRNQSAGLLVPEDRAPILDLYADFGLARDQARGFRYEYFSPGQTIGRELPSQLGELGVGHTIVSFKALEDKERCDLFADILDGVFDHYAASESETTCLLIVIEEAHRFTKKRVDESARSAATKAENALDRTVREGRKFGCCVVILSQTIRDFAYDSASIRQNTNTKIFMHNSDREVDYAADFIGDGRQIIQLPPATAIVYHPTWGASKVRIRPPFSKVWEFSAQETRRLVDDPATVTLAVSKDARTLLTTIRDLHAVRRGGINVTELSEQVGINSKRRIQVLLAELERANLVRSRRLRARGKPRIIEPITSATRTESRTSTGQDVDQRNEIR